MHWLGQPRKIFFICLGYLFLHLFMYDTATNLYSLIKGEEHLLLKMKEHQIEIKKIEKQIQLVKDPNYLERQAVDHFDLVGENDLLFVFPDADDADT